ncbi:uncharacterized protein LOC134261956 isoform X2 [Saccostrea cucullata]
MQLFHITFEFGPSELNLFKLISEELYYVWKETYETVKEVQEPIEGLFLITEDGENVKDLCLKLFKFSPETTDVQICEKVGITRNAVVICHLGKSFWKEEIPLDALQSLIKDVEKSMLFFLVESEVDIERKIKLVKRESFSFASHVLDANSEKSIIYEKCYAGLEKDLADCICALKMKTNTRQLSGFLRQIEKLQERLLTRKSRDSSNLTKECIRNIKDAKKHGVVGYRLCGKTLLIFERQQPLNDQSRRSITSHFQGDVKFLQLKRAFTPQCAIRCGGEIINKRIEKRGSLGMFGQITNSMNQDDSFSSIIAIASGHLYNEGDLAEVQQHGEDKSIGLCIWPNGDTLGNGRLHDISVIKIYKSVLPLLSKTVEELNENVYVYGQPLSTLADRLVFKFGAATAKTKGYVKKVSDFEVFDGDVMVISPRIGFEKFSNKGDSGSVVLTRIENRLYAVGIVFGGDLDLSIAECLSAKKETIAASLKNALNRFTRSTKRSITFDKI